MDEFLSGCFTLTQPFTYAGVIDFLSYLDSTVKVN